MPRSLPEDPIIRSLVQQARRAQLTRRSMLGVTGGGAAALALAACAPTRSGASRPRPRTISDTDKSLIWANWPAYLDEDEDGNYPTLERFIEETGIETEYRVDIDDNNSYYAKVKDQLALGQDIGADLVCLTDWMVSRWIRFGYTQELDHANIPNIRRTSTPTSLNIDYDHGTASSRCPWQGGFAGICWNKEEVPNGLSTVADLWQASSNGRVGVLSEMRDTMGLIMLEQGVDISGDFTDDQFDEALDVFEEKVGVRPDPQHQGQLVPRRPAERRHPRRASAGRVTSPCSTPRPATTWEFIIPEAGGTLWNDNFMIPVGSPHKKNAETLMNYYYEPEVAAEVAAWVNYITPVVGAEEAAAEAIDPELAENQLIFPNEETLSNATSSAR